MPGPNQSLEPHWNAHRPEVVALVLLLEPERPPIPIWEGERTNGRQVTDDEREPLEIARLIALETEFERTGP